MIEQAKQVAQRLREGWPYRGADARIMCEGAAGTIDALVAEVEDVTSMYNRCVDDVHALRAEVERLKQEPVHVRERWNIETDGDDLLICFNMHDKHEKCDYQRYTPKQEQAEPVVELGDGFMFCSACKSVQDSAHHTSPHDHDVWCSGIAQWVQGPFYTAPKEDQAEPVARETYNRVFDDREKQTALLRQALEALEEATHYTSTPAWSPSMTRDCEIVVANIKQHLGEA